MSPDPTQEPVEESLNVPNLPLDRGMNASDSEDDDMGMAGYVPLSQIPADSDPMLYEDEVCLLYIFKNISFTYNKYLLYIYFFISQDDEWISNAGESNQTLRPPILESQNVCILLDLRKNVIIFVFQYF